MKWWAPGPVVLLLAGMLAAGCSTGPLSGLVRTSSPHERYHDTLRRSGLDQTALGSDWTRASEEALRSPMTAELPFHETGYFGPDDASAIAYQFDLRRGRRLEVVVTFHSANGGQLFVDLFRVSNGAPPRLMSSMPSEQLTLEFEATEDATYLLRLQPELLRGGRYTVVERTLSSLSFPVPGFTASAVQSGFGAARNAGARVHEGIDIFAPRGTPVVAVAGGVAGTGTNPLGGNVVWLHAAGRRYYYAHLDDWAISGTSRVRAGDVLGYVGNSGNARTTAPHLHFGIYMGAAIDPLPFVQPDDELPPVPPTPSALGGLARVVPSRVPMREGPRADATVRRQLDRGTLARVMGATSNALRVVLPDDSVGYVRASAMTEASAVLRRQRLTSGAVLREVPAPDAPAVDMLADDLHVDVIGVFDGYAFVRTPRGERGWVDSATSTN